MWNWNSEMIACDEVEKYIDLPVNAATVVAGDSTLFRVSKDMLTDANEQPENVAMLNDYYGTTWWFSIINSDVQSYANMSAQETLKWRSWGFDNNLMYEAFAGVKYYFCSKPENVKEEYKWVEQVTFNGESWDVYENPYYFGMAYIRDADTASAIFDEAAGYEEYYEKLYDLYIDGQHQVALTNSAAKNMLTCTVDTG
ncbi:MAG: YfhO family protein, partial [Lachnospiraceae bacterium]|nr:YfhO family protein [Lachnospiraceae bacterium]